MKKMRKVLSLLILCSLMATALLGCGGSAENDLAVSEDTSPAVSENTAASEDTAADSTQSTAVSDGVMKKVVYVQENIDQYYNEARKNTFEELKKNGFDSQNTEIKELYMSGDNKKTSEEIVNTIKEFKPDVVCFQNGMDVVKQLEGTDIPCIISSAAESYVDKDGTPLKNVTGVYTAPSDLYKKAYSFLNQIAPINGKKAVFITVDGFFTKELIEENLKANNIELKDYCESKYVEDFKAAVEKYNKDPEVGWMLVGIWPWTTKDGTSVPQNEFANWDATNRMKPSVTYWDVAVGLGMLCGLGVDIPNEGNQQGEMAARILKGEKINSVKAEEPKKINIAVNTKNAEQLGINFPADVLGSAAGHIYTDYEGTLLK